MPNAPSHALPNLDAFADRVYYLVTQIPSGEVATYGQIAHLAGATGAARACGSALKQCVQAGQGDIPWHRVINAQGGISFKGDVQRAELQRKLLTKEGIDFTSRDMWRCTLDHYEWSPTDPYWSVNPVA